jgi:hypothetical protein
VSYAWAATRFRWGVCLVAAFAAYFSAVALLSLAPPAVDRCAAGIRRTMGCAAAVSRIAPAASMPASRGNDIYLHDRRAIWSCPRFSAASAHS